MNSAIKWVVAVLVVALIAVIGLIVMSTDNEESEPAAVATTAPETTTQPEETAEPQKNTEATPGSANEEAQEEAQGTMYEGALAGLTEEEIAAMAIAEEESAARTESDAGAEDAVD